MAVVVKGIVVVINEIPSGGFVFRRRGRQGSARKENMSLSSALGTGKILCIGTAINNRNHDLLIVPGKMIFHPACLNSHGGIISVVIGGAVGSPASGRGQRRCRYNLVKTYILDTAVSAEGFISSPGLRLGLILQEIKSPAVGCKFLCAPIV